MNYKNIIKAEFLERPNRFIAHCKTNDGTIVAHVKNTGRCKELLIPHCTVYLEYAPSKTRKTDYSLICVEKGSLLINMDSSAPNKIFLEYLRENKSTLSNFQNLKTIAAEKTFGNSRFDFYIEGNGRTAFGEIKGVTLEEDGVVLFPDAPTLRGLKHVNELCEAIKQGFDAYLIFVVQLEDATCFTPNNKTQPQFGQALKAAKKAGVHLHAFTCHVSPQEITLKKEIPIVL